MNILIITPRIPYPPYRGDKLKIFNIAKQLSKNNSVKILTFIRNKKQKDDLKAFEKYGIEIQAIKFNLLESLISVAINSLRKLPFQVAWYKSGKMEKAVSEHLSGNKYHLAYFHLIRMAQYFDENIKNSRTIKVIDFTDAVSLYLSRFLSVERNPLKKMFLKIELKRITEYEKISEKFDTLFICSDTDKSFLRENGIKTKISILRNGIDTEYFFPEECEVEKNRIIFTGNMPYFANYDAVLYFAKEIFPLVVKKVPGAKFYVVGQKPPQRIKALHSNNIIITGFVDDIKKEYLKSAVNVAPVRFGAGTLNKVLESIALGVPVVASSIAIEGLPKELLNYIVVADSSTEFAEAVTDILLNYQNRKNIMNEGKEVIKQLLSWGNIVAGFEKELINLVRSKSIQ